MICIIVLVFIPVLLFIFGFGLLSMFFWWGAKIFKSLVYKMVGEEVEERTK